MAAAVPGHVPAAYLVCCREGCSCASNNGGCYGICARCTHCAQDEVCCSHKQAAAHTSGKGSRMVVSVSANREDTQLPVLRLTFASTYNIVTCLPDGPNKLWS
jgi:hypothetical protein